MSLIQERRAQTLENLSNERDDIAMRRLQGRVHELSYVESRALHEDLILHARQVASDDFAEERRTTDGR